MSGHKHHDHLDWNERGEIMEREAEVVFPLVEQAFQWVREVRPEAGRVLDIGSGPGVAACQLARLYPDAEVVAVDGAPALLERAAARAERLGVRLTTRHAQLPDEFGELGTADVVWIGQVLHHLGDQEAGLAELAGLLRPGGVLALMEGGLPFRFLPRDIGIGRTGFQSRLDVAVSTGFAEMRAELPGKVDVVEDWAAMIGRAGMRHVGTRSFLVDHPSRIDERTRRYVHSVLTGWGDFSADRLSEEDAATLARLLDPEDEAGVLRRPDAFVLGARTIYLATTP
ncbi:class I SAM-dependent methyltransferase [Allokutzneria sp. A3M-2-11 16]|uniref:class I SAM-dependent methyltransferase n=1 Tax=Allokutzneria sp. A3M-2-11 16 TaxID=2962043 RepID=UPI0020B68FCB|nr:class I SAM-dependent methyltransferase [Allokutzneria sp. A3M-2-11 16]MCP3802052.1 class I SAM-dependent methyltransferase [Allokutzneria sp. A3M-2-11 16]